MLVTLMVGQPMWTGLTFAQGPPQQITTPAGTIMVPSSSVENPGDIAVRAHTNHLIFVPQRTAATASVPSGETPGSLACIYQTTATTAGCPKSTATLPSGGSAVIAIVDAYDYPTAENDLNVFSSQFGLPACTTANGCFLKAYANGNKPRGNCGWNQEAALDIEWAHAMSPSAKIVLVEAASNSFSSLLQAVNYANTYITNHGGKGEVSMSWGGSEFSSETASDSNFSTPGVVYFASSGDTGGQTIWPGVSPNVVSAGGTTINRDISGNFTTETAWNGSGGGPSRYEPRPSYQNPIATTVGSHRGAPDFSFDADPNSGVSVYDSTSCGGSSGWLVFGGTSVASPSLAGIVNLVGTFNSSSSAELGEIYSICGSGPASSCSSANFSDIKSGTAGSFSATTGWDFVTGVGSNIGPLGK